MMLSRDFQGLDSQMSQLIYWPMTWEGHLTSDSAAELGVRWGEAHRLPPGVWQGQMSQGLWCVQPAPCSLPSVGLLSPPCPFFPRLS